jgi:hypothetical protein
MSLPYLCHQSFEPPVSGLDALGYLGLCASVFSVGWGAVKNKQYAGEGWYVSAKLGCVASCAVVGAGVVGASVSVPVLVSTAAVSSLVVLSLERREDAIKAQGLEYSRTGKDACCSQVPGCLA